MEKHKDLNVLLDVTRWKFSNEVPYMDFYIVHKHKGQRYVMNYLKGLTGVLLNVTEPHGPTVQFSSTWTTSIESGPTIIDMGTFLPRRSSVLNTSYVITSFNRVKSFSVFDFGYQLKTDTNLELYAYYGEKIIRPTAAQISNIVEEGNFEIPEIQSGVSTETQHVWLRDEDDSDSLLRRRVDKPKVNGRKLDVESEL